MKNHITEEETNYFNQGYALYNLGKYEEAVVAFDKAIELDNQDIMGAAYMCKGVALSLAEKEDMALLAYEKAISKCCAGVYYCKGLLLFNSGELDEALLAYESAVELVPDYAEAHNGIGEVWYGFRQYEQALAAYKKAISLKKGYAIAYRNKGCALKGLGNYKEAIIAFNKAIELKDYFSYIHKGDTLYNLEKYEEALLSYESVIELIPDHVEAYNDKGIVLYAMERYEEAITAYDKAISLKKDYAIAYLNKGEALQKLQRYKEATVIFDEAIKLGQREATVIGYKASLMLEAGRHKEAVELINKALYLEPQNIDLLIRQGNIYFNMENYKEAINSYDKAITLGDNKNKAAAGWKEEALIELKKIAVEKDFAELIEYTPLSPQAKIIARQKLNLIKSSDNYNSDKSYHLKYLQNLLKLPWGKYDEVNIDIKKSEELLEASHYGLESVKNRILESLVFMARSKEAKPPILCLVGAPGIGKTSIAKSIAKALQRKSITLSLAGANDIGLIRGCMNFYLGATPGRILTLMSEAGTCNPVMILDEIDKIDYSRNANLEGALLQLIDPSQNSSFTDDYFDFSFDMSKVLFIATANSLAKISYPLVNRMKVIEISGYTDREKEHIVKNYILPKILKEANLFEEEFLLNEDIIKYLIKFYTEESGVRDIERLVEELVQKYLLEKVRGKNPIINIRLVEQYFSSPEYNIEGRSRELEVGVAHRLSWTARGGSLGTVEVEKYPGKGKVKTTGKLGEVLKESIEAAYGYLKSHYKELNIKEEDFKNYDLHVHYPEGGISKDGPSGGIAIYTAIASLLTGQKVNSNIAMTGEITLKGKVLPIGGLKEKLSAAVRGNISIVIIPEENKRDLVKIPDEIKNALTIKTISYAKELLDIVFV